MSAPVPVRKASRDLHLTLSALELIYPLARIAERTLPSDDPGRKALTAIASSLDGMCEVLEGEVSK